MAKVITLDLAKQLAEVAEKHGVKLPESEYSHSWNTLLKRWELTFHDAEGEEGIMYSNSIPAYQTDELLEWIRKFGAREIRLWPLKNHYWGGCCPFSLPKDNQLSNTPRDTVCRLAIDLVEKGIIT